MNCAQIELLIPLYAGGDLSAEQTSLLRDHLERCDRCRAVAADFNESRNWMIDAASPQIDQSVFIRLRDDLHREIAAINRPRPVFGRLAFRFGLAAAGLSALIVFAVVYDRLTAPDPGLPIAESILPHPPSERIEETGSETTARPPARARKRKTMPRQSPAAVPTAPSTVGAVAINQASPADSAPEMTRIELQTADPNIRIIWLVQKGQER